MKVIILPYTQLNNAKISGKLGFLCLHFYFTIYMIVNLICLLFFFPLVSISFVCELQIDMFNHRLHQLAITNP